MIEQYQALGCYYSLSKLLYVSLSYVEMLYNCHFSYMDRCVSYKKAAIRLKTFIVKQCDRY